MRAPAQVMKTVRSKLLHLVQAEHLREKLQSQRRSDTEAESEDDRLAGIRSAFELVLKQVATGSEDALSLLQLFLPRTYVCGNHNLRSVLPASQRSHDDFVDP